MPESLSKTFTDQTGVKIILHQTPQRIISVVPSQTELLFNLGLTDEVIGVTKFCVHPESWFRSKTRVGGTKKLNIEKIKSLTPDLVIANKEENVKEQIELLSKENIPVWISDIKNLKDALAMIHSIGTIVNRNKKAEQIIQQIENNFRALEKQTASIHNKTVLYLIWRKPYMTIGGDTFIHNMIAACGFKNVCGSLNRYPEITAEQIAEANADFIFLSSEPYPFKEKHIHELKIISPNSQIELVNGEYFSWYGSRLVHAPEYFNQMIKSIT